VPHEMEEEEEEEENEESKLHAWVSETTQI
jgi:hypothetical protein